MSNIIENDKEVHFAVAHVQAVVTKQLIVGREHRPRFAAASGGAIQRHHHELGLGAKAVLKRPSFVDERLVSLARWAVAKP